MPSKEHRVNPIRIHGNNKNVFVHIYNPYKNIDD